MRLSSTATPLVLLTLLGSASLASQDTRPIRRGQTVNASLETGDLHRYTISLDADTYVYGAANQLNVDVVVRVKGPDGVTIREFDLPNRGEERFWFDSEDEGEHVIEVAPFEDETGDYTLVLEIVERVATNPRRRLDQMMRPYDGRDTPGAVIGIVENGRLAYVKAYGMANLTYEIPFSERTVSNIGSVTKQFTAMGLLLLEADGKLSLDDDVRKHIPELPDFGVEITLRNLLNHTGGLRELYNLMPLTGYTGEDPLPRDMPVRIVQRQPDLQDPPNTAFNYNNTGYILVARTIERVSGMSFPDFMKERVFEPLGMTNTRVKDVQGEIIPGSAMGYVPRDGGGYRSVRDLAISAGAGGIYTTVEDLAKWMMNYRDKTVGGEAAISAITTSAVLESGDTTNYGLGLGVRPHRGQMLYTHTGGDVAHRTFFGYFPDMQSGVIAMSNNGAFPTGTGIPIAEAFFDEHFEPEEEEVVTEDADRMSAERMETIAGTWRIADALDIVYTVEDDQLHAQATGQPKFGLRTPTDSTAEFQGVEATVTFHFKPDGTVDSATHHQGRDVPMVRADRTVLTAEDLQAYTGRYYSDELEVAMEITLEGDTLKAFHIRMNEPLTLTHRSGQRFSGGAFPFSDIEFDRAGNGTVRGFRVSNGRVKGVWFQRR